MDILQLNLKDIEPAVPSAAESRFQVALLAGVIGTASSLLARFIFDAPLLPELLAQAIFAILPINLIALVVGFLGPFAKHLAFVACVIIYAAALTAAAFFFLRLPQMQQPTQTIVKRLLYFSIFLVTVWALTILLILPVLGGGILGSYLRQGVVFSITSFFLIYVCYTLALYFFSNLYIERPEIAHTNSYRLSRRRVMRGVGYAVLAVGIYDIAKSLAGTWFQFNSGRVHNANGPFPNLNGLALEITPTEDFYEVSKNPFDPETSVHKWRLEVGGLVETPLRLSLEEIQSLPAVEQYATLECIDNQVGGNLISNAMWRGVHLRELLERAGLKDGIFDIVLHAADGYSDSIPIDRAMREGTLLVYEMNGKPLTTAHGFPLRLLVPGIYGMKNVKWITKIEAVNYDFKGYWQKRGWDDRAEYKIMSRIDVPESSITGQTSIAGIAFAGDKGISKIEVSTDGGKNWQEAAIKPALSPYSWVLWHQDWTPAQAGEHRIKVRATDGRGVLQTSQFAPPDPDGASGYHEITLRSS